MGFRIASAPVSWGIFENREPPAEYPYPRVLDEIAAAGYAGTELGPYGFYPTDPGALRAELDRRGLTLCSAFVAMHWGDAALHEAGLAHVERSAKLVSALSSRLLILSDEISTERSTVAGRAASHADTHWSKAQWATASEALRRAIDLCQSMEMRVAFHPHVGTHVETPEEVDRLLGLFGDELGLCLDTGHCFYGGGDPLDAVRRYRQRLLCMHLKDVNGSRLDAARSSGWDFYKAVSQGVFAPLGQGEVDFPAVIHFLRDGGFSGWVVAEQDVLPGGRGADSPLANARAGHHYLKSLGM